MTKTKKPRKFSEVFYLKILSNKQRGFIEFLRSVD